MRPSRTFLVIGLTGGAGSGKTTVVSCLKELTEVCFLHCDEMAHELMEPGGKSYQALLSEYGEEILDGTQTGISPISREKLSKIALATKERAERLNAITHPLVKERVEEQLQELEEQGFSGVAVIEAALLIEAGFAGLCDAVWYIHAPLADRVQRMKKIRGYSEEKIERILAAQMTEKEFLAHADVVIENPDEEPQNQKKQLLSQLKDALQQGTGISKRKTGK